jgi:5-methylcytosine-specific restriction enzyme A
MTLPNPKRTDISVVTAEAVKMAVAEFNELGRGAFLKKYGFRQSQYYLLHFEGSEYDSKAIIGAAFGYLPGSPALKCNEFSSQKSAVKRHLEHLGFDVISTGHRN